MLRITADDHARVLTFRLEGRLEGAWVSELDQCWRGLLQAAREPRVTIDLTGVTYIDAAGKAHLAAMHARGAEFIAADCMMQAVVEEIAGADRPARAAAAPDDASGDDAASRDGRKPR
jgi:ABC-type transporter Mla MlaB component